MRFDVKTNAPVATAAEVAIRVALNIFIYFKGN